MGIETTTRREGGAGSARTSSFFRSIAALLLSGGSFHAPVSKRQAERSFGNRIDIPVPEMGLGPRLRGMRDWCSNRITPQSWSMHSHHVGTGTGRGHILRFYFASQEDAEAFSHEWGRASCGIYRERSPSVIARAQAALSARFGSDGQALYAF